MKKQKVYYFQMESKAAPVTDGGDVFIEGYASTPDVDRYGDVVEPEAFTNALPLFMKNPVVLYQHDEHRPVGTVESAKVMDQGLWVRVKVIEEDSKQKVLDGRMRTFSFCWVAKAIEFRHRDGAAFNPIEDSIYDPDIVRVVKELDLIEISIVTTPANGNALFSVAKSVKSFFKERLTEAFDMTNRKDAPGMGTPEAPAAPVAAPADVKVETTTETTIEAPKPAEAPAEAKADPVAPDEKKEGEEEEKKPEAPAPTTTPTNGEQPQKADEKADEKPAADSPEAPKGEEGKAESKSVAAEEGKDLIVAKSVAQLFPDLIEAGHMSEEKSAGQGVSLPKAVTNLMRKMCDAFVSEAKRAEDLEVKLADAKKTLDSLPVKSALRVHGQYVNPEPEKSSPKQPSEEFMNLFRQR